MAPQVVRAELVAPAVARALAEQRGGQPRAGADGGFPAVRAPPGVRAAPVRARGACL